MKVTFVGGTKDGIETDAKIRVVMENVKMRVSFFLDEEMEEVYEFDGKDTFSLLCVRERSKPEPDGPKPVEERSDVRDEQYPLDLSDNGLENDALRPG